MSLLLYFPALYWEKRRRSWGVMILRWWLVKCTEKIIIAMTPLYCKPNACYSFTPPLHHFVPTSVLQRIEQLEFLGYDRITWSLFDTICRRNPEFMQPVFEFHRLLRQTVVGERFWLKIEEKRKATLKTMLGRELIPRDLPVRPRTTIHHY